MSAITTVESCPVPEPLVGALLVYEHAREFAGVEANGSVTDAAEATEAFRAVCGELGLLADWVTLTAGGEPPGGDGHVFCRVLAHDRVYGVDWAARRLDPALACPLVFEGPQHPAAGHLTGPETQGHGPLRPA